MDWKDLLRIVLIDDVLHADPDHNKPGRGGWLHPSCFGLAVQRKAFARAFKSSSDVKIEELENYLKSLK